MRTKNVWWGNQGILGVGNRHDNSPAMAAAPSTNKKRREATRGSS